MVRFLTVFFLSMIAMTSAFAQSDGDERDTVVVAQKPAHVAAATDPLIGFDVNNDKVVNAVDVVDIVRYTKGSQRSVFNVSKADINNDGKVNLDDASALSDLVAGGELPTSSDKPLQGDAVTDPEGPTP